MSEANIRDFVKSLNFSNNWANRVDKMPYEQVFAIYNKYRNNMDRKKIKVDYKCDDGFEFTDTQRLYSCSHCLIRFPENSEHIFHDDLNIPYCLCPNCASPAY